MRTHADLLMVLLKLKQRDKREHITFTSAVLEVYINVNNYD